MVHHHSKSDSARYNFKAGIQGWVAQTYEDSQAITTVEQETSKAKYGVASLICTVDLKEYNHPNKAKGETFVDLQTSQNMSNATATLWVWILQDAVGDPSHPNFIQVFFKDTDWKSKYSSHRNIGTDIPTNKWVKITVNTETEQWAVDTGANLSQIRLVGVKIGTGDQSTTTFSGYIWIDSVNW